MADNIKVYARFRPLVGRDLRLSAAARAPAFSVTGNTICMKQPGKSPSQSGASRVVSSNRGAGSGGSNVDPAAFSFDDVFAASTTQQQLFERVGRVGVNQLLEGYNSTILTYGQTGSGKTFSMYGDDSSCWKDWDSEELPQEHGLVPRVVALLMDQIAERHAQNSEVQYVTTCSFLEIYNEKIKDLFDPATSKKVRVRDTKHEGVWIQGLSQETVASKQDVADLVRLGFGMRSVGMTLMNERSSRSHCIFILTLHQNYPDGSSKISKLNLVDLAGSERVSRSGVEGQAMREAQNINKSLSCLGICINALAEQGRQHIPYRDSSLTHLLKESLGGNAKTFLVIALSQCRIDAEESISTLRFGTRAKTVKNRAVVNVKKSNDELETQLEALRRYVGILETENAQLRAGSTSIEATSSATGLSFSSATALSKADKSSPVMPQAIAEDLRNISELQSRGGSSFVELDMECQTLRRRVKSQESTIAALKATFAVLMSRLTDAQSQVKALTSEKQALELDLRVGRMNNASTAVAVAELESTTRILKNREAEILRREKAIAEARVEVENESDEVRRAIKKQCEQDIAFRQRDTSLRHRMRDFEEHVKRQNADMLAAQQRLDDAAAQLLQLEAAVGQSSSSRRKKLDVDGEQSAWKNQLDVAEDRIRQLTQQLSDARRGQAADPATDGGVESPDVLVLDGGRVHLSHAHFASSSERTEFPKLWAAAGEKALQGLGENDNEDDDTTRGLATIVEGLRLRRMQLLEQKQQLLSPTAMHCSSPGSHAETVAQNSSDADAAQREKWRRSLRSRGGAESV